MWGYQNYPEFNYFLSCLAKVSITVGFQLSRERRVVAPSLEMLSYPRGTKSEAYIGFNHAKKAILRCQRNGYNLPKDKYADWKNIELKFEP